MEPLPYYSLLMCQRLIHGLPPQAIFVFPFPMPTAEISSLWSLRLNFAVLGTISIIPVYYFFPKGFPMTGEKIFLGRQPILDRQQNTIGHELLFRATDCLQADVQDHSQASANVIVNTLSNFGFEKVLGNKKGFINVNNDLLMSDTLELLPAKWFVLELLEIVQVNNAVIERCRELKLKGFTLALDDHMMDASYNPLYELVHIVKVDILQFATPALMEMVQQLRRWPVTMLAEKVETIDQFRQCCGLGFDLFQGYYFARPALLRQQKIGTAKVTLMKLLEQVLSDAEITEIEKTFKQNPDLIYKLLRLVNSVMIGSREKIKSIRQAIVTIGLQHLKRWVLMALFASRDASSPQNPLLEMAAHRGKFMELLAEKQSLPAKSHDYPDLAFITGLLSLLDVQFGLPREEIVDHLNLDEEIRLALLNREGALGNLLLLCEKLEQADFKAVPGILSQSRISLGDLLQSQLQGINWTNDFCACACQQA